MSPRSGVSKGRVPLREASIEEVPEPDGRAASHTSIQRGLRLQAVPREVVFPRRNDHAFDDLEGEIQALELGSDVGLEMLPRLRLHVKRRKKHPPGFRISLQVIHPGGKHLVEELAGPVKGTV